MDIFRKYNYFTTKHYSGHFSCLKRIVDFFENDGYNFFLLLNTKEFYKSPFRGSYTYHVEFNDITDLRYILEDKSNFFNVDVILIDLMEMDIEDILEHKKELEKIEGDYKFLIMCNYNVSSESIKINGETKIFEIEHVLTRNITFHKPSKFGHIYKLKDIDSDFKFDLDNLFETHLRKSKINKILKKRNTNNI